MLHVILPLHIHFSRPLQKLSSKKPKPKTKQHQTSDNNALTDSHSSQKYVFCDLSYNVLDIVSDSKYAPVTHLNYYWLYEQMQQGKKGESFIFFKAFHNVINHSFVVANMNCAPNVTNLVLFAKIKGWIIAQHHRWKICTLMSYESDMIIFPKFSKMLVWAGLHTQSEHTHTVKINEKVKKLTDWASYC